MESQEEIENPNGHIVITVFQARQLAPIDDNTTCDPFCKIHVGSKVAHTAILRNELNPRWNERFHIPYRLAYGPIRVQILDQNRILSNEPLGEVVIDVSQMINVEYRAWYRLAPRCNRIYVGDIDILCKLELPGIPPSTHPPTGPIPGMLPIGPTAAPPTAPPPDPIACSPPAPTVAPTPHGPVVGPPELSCLGGPPAPAVIPIALTEPQPEVTESDQIEEKPKKKKKKEKKSKKGKKDKRKKSKKDKKKKKKRDEEGSEDEHSEREESEDEPSEDEEESGDESEED
eukprot:gnl/Trimastix_PCT/852.p1 GENE.gnl/Trimastix_PCT/852~~gnl/Trimastix_PCT/852.p1  ORF type:complete len:287 (+),score=67.11 gnl/Trimastix_PCT/852:91-951(+)